MPKTKKRRGLPVVNDRAAGIDIGSRFRVAAIPADLSDEPVQTFQSFTTDLHRMADWLIASGITTVAMESTGVYWAATFEILDERGLEVLLANARDVRSVPGRKTDVIDAQWLQRKTACSIRKGSNLATVNRSSFNGANHNPGGVIEAGGIHACKGWQLLSIRCVLSSSLR